VNTHIASIVERLAPLAGNASVFYALAPRVG
jgi:hypothetical protein